MSRFLRTVVFVGLALCASVAGATFHTYQIDEIYSNADGTVQYVVLHESQGMNGQNQLMGLMLTDVRPAGVATFVFPRNLPGESCDSYGCMPSPTAGTRVLIATQGFVNLGLVMPDFVVPNGFLATGGGTLNYAGVDQVTYGPLPVDGVNALYRSGSVGANFAMNFNGDTATVQAPPPALNVQGIWYNSPAESESGWGINFAHQGDIVFASWFTYDSSGRGWWLVMTATKTGPNTYAGDLFETTGPAFNAQPFDPNTVARLKAGTGTLTFTGANNGSFDYTISSIHQIAVSPVRQTKSITRQVFGPLPTCVFGGPPTLALATNYQDLWWAAPAGSESGWGINLNHEGDNIFATWFTYDLDGTSLWLSGTAARTGPGVYSGDLFRTTGPAFNALPFNPAAVGRNKVGTMTFTFANGSSGTFDYIVQMSPLPGPVHQTKTITRQLFTASGTTCQ